MTDIRTRIRVDPDHRISGTAPAAVPPGEHEVMIAVARPQRPKQRPRVVELPTHAVPWDGSISLRREDMYGENGR
jgi:hypothetical protein